MSQRLLLDTDVLVEYLRGRDEALRFMAEAVVHEPDQMSTHASTG